MPTDATGTPTSNFSFPTINTANDAPSGLGENSIITDVDTKLAASTTLLGAVARAIIAKNGTTTGTRRKINLIEGSGITIVQSDDAAGEKVDVTINASSSTASLVTSLPGSPVDGQEVILVDSTTAPTYGVRLRYVSAASKWIRVGDMPWTKTTAKTVNTTITDTDLLNGEFTLKANMLGTDRGLRLTAWGDHLNNAGSIAIPRFSFKLGGTTIFDTGTGGNTSGISTARRGWRVAVELMNLGATNSQWCNLLGHVPIAAANTGGVGAFVTGEGTTGSTSAGGQAFAVSMQGGASAAIDTTADQALVLSVINGSASANVETKLLGAKAEIL